MIADQFIVRSWTEGDTDLEVKGFATNEEAQAYAKATRQHGYVAEVTERQPDLFEAV